MSEPATNVTEAMAAAAKEAGANPKLAQARLKLHAEGAHRQWDAYVPLGVRPDQIIKEGFWTHVGHLLRPADEVRVMSDDLSFRMKVFVRSAGRNFAVVAPCDRLYVFAGKAQPPASASPYRVDYAGPHVKHRVLRGNDVLKQGFDTEDQARQWAKNHEGASRR